MVLPFTMSTSYSLISAFKWLEAALIALQACTDMTIMPVPDLGRYNNSSSYGCHYTGMTTMPSANLCACAVATTTAMAMVVAWVPESGSAHWISFGIGTPTS